MNKIIQKWRLTRHRNIPISRYFNTYTMLFANGHILLTKSEDKLQYSVHNLNNSQEFTMKIETGKRKIMPLEKMNQSEASYTSITECGNKGILPITGM
jgi:hypothetical protein